MNAKWHCCLTHIDRILTVLIYCKRLNRVWVMENFLKVLIIIISAADVYCSIASDHECNRRCNLRAASKTCVYNFTVEWYQTLSKACYDCPFVQSDCYRPHCIAADGNTRALLAINRMLPGPSIEVCEDDTIIVNVKNMMEDGGTVTLHWHGLHQYKTPYMDGASHVTQCGINVKETFRYEFKAKPQGTHWYHSHVSTQIANGLFGAFIVRAPHDMDPVGLLYEKDLSEHIIMVNDWLPIISTARYMSLMHDRFDMTLPVSSIINGRAKKYNVTDRAQTYLPPAQTPMEIFHVNQNTTYRFRVIGSSAACPMKLAIDGHLMTVIAADGMAIEPRTVSTMILHPGERFDFVLDTHAPADNYIIRFWGLSDCLVVNDAVYALLRYNGAEDVEPVIDEFFDLVEGVFLNPILINDGNPIYTNKELDLPMDELRSLRYNRVENYSSETVDLVYYIATDFNNNDNQIYNHPVYYPVQDLPPSRSHYTPVLNNVSFVLYNSNTNRGFTTITFDLPPIPVLSQLEDVQQSWFCNKSSLDMTACKENLCICTHLISFTLNQTVDIILVNEGKAYTAVGHPMHIHGHSFRVLGTEKLGESVSVSEIEGLEKEGKLKRNLINPPWKDTINVPDGGYVIIRVIANNPGMAMLIKVGEDSDVPNKPENFPRCGGMDFTFSRTLETTTMEVCNKSIHNRPLKLVQIFLLFLTFYVYT